MADLTKKVGERVRARRTEMGLSQDDLSARSGISQKTISKLEAGDAASRIDVLAKVADGLQLKVSELLSGVHSPPRVFEPTPLEALEIVRKALAASPASARPLTAMQSRFIELITALNDSELLGPFETVRPTLERLARASDPGKRHG